MNDAQRLITIVAYLLSEDGDNPEYDRACAEIVTEYLGFPMDAKDEVLHLLRVKGGVNEPASVTEAGVSRLLEDRPEGCYFLGDLSKGKAAAGLSRHIVIVTPENHQLGSYQVNLCDDEADPQGSIAEFGAGKTEEIAWRYALGAFFGPVDDEYQGDEWLSRFLNEPEVNEPESVTEPYVLHYISADGPGESATWSVYREFYPSDGDESPIEGTQVHVSRHATEYVAAAEALRLQAQANKPASVTEYQGRHRS